MTIDEIYEKHTGTNMELEYIPTPKENVIAAMKEFADQEVDSNSKAIIGLILSYIDWHEYSTDSITIGEIQDILTQWKSS